MIRTITYRVTQAAISFVIAISFTFVLIRMMPGGAKGYIEAQLAQAGAATPRELNLLVQEYLIVDPDDPLHIQYIGYVTSVLGGDLGTSLWYRRPVVDVVLEGLVWTVFYASIAVTLIFAIGILLGAYVAYHERSRLDSIVSVVSIVLNSTPYYVVGLLALYIFAYQLGWFPTGGRMSSGMEPSFSVGFITDILHHAALPIFSLVVTAFGIILLLMRGNSISILGSDYLRVARLRGLPERRIAWRYVARNAILPMYTHAAVTMAFVFSGSVLLEMIYRYDGIGWFVYQGIRSHDYPLLMGGFIVITLAVIVALNIADLTYRMLDPRLGEEGGS